VLRQAYLCQGEYLLVFTGKCSDNKTGCRLKTEVCTKKEIVKMFQAKLPKLFLKLYLLGYHYMCKVI